MRALHEYTQMAFRHQPPTWSNTSLFAHTKSSLKSAKTIRVDRCWHKKGQTSVFASAHAHAGTRRNKSLDFPECHAACFNTCKTQLYFWSKTSSSQQPISWTLLTDFVIVVLNEWEVGGQFLSILINIDVVSCPFIHALKVRNPLNISRTVAAASKTPITLCISPNFPNVYMLLAGDKDLNKVCETWKHDKWLHRCRDFILE